MPISDPQERKTYAQEHYQNNKQKYKDAMEASRARKLDRLRSLKSGPCEDCGQSYHPDIMHFHHLDPATKDGSIGRMFHRWGWAKIEAEAKKCVLLCANCHGLRHVAEREALRTGIEPVLRG